jgi:hypothetical protein
MIKPSDLTKVAIIITLVLAASNFLQQYVGQMDWAKAADRSLSQVAAVFMVVGIATLRRKK